MEILRSFAAAALAVVALTHTPIRAQTATPTTDGEVRKIDTAQAKITLKHGPIANLDMPGMTMVFRVADPAWLKTLHEGDKVRFAADKVGGVYTVTAIEAAK